LVRVRITPAGRISIVFPGVHKKTEIPGYFGWM